MLERFFFFKLVIRKVTCVLETSSGEGKEASLLLVSRNLSLERQTKRTFLTH